MSTRLRDVLMEQLGRAPPRARREAHPGALGDQTVIDSTRAMLVWEPKRIMPTYAVPAVDINGEISAAPADTEPSYPRGT